MQKFVRTVPNKSLFYTDLSSVLVGLGTDFEYQTCANEFSFRRAMPSGLVYIDPLPHQDDICLLYPASYEPYCFDELKPIVRNARDWVQRGKVERIKAVAPDTSRILDVGCGNGALLRLMRKYGPKNWQLHANDSNSEMLRVLSEQGFVVHFGAIEALALSEKFDVIILNQVIEHFAQIRLLLGSCRALLKDGGILFIETPSTDGLDTKIFKRGFWGGYHIPRHFFLFNEENITCLLQESGFKLRKVEYLLSPAFWIQSLHHFFCARKMQRLANIFSLKNVAALCFFSLLDRLILVLGGRTSNMRIVALAQE